MKSFKPAIAYLPHQLPMVLVDTVQDVGDDYAECGVNVTRDGILAPFMNENEAVPAWFAIEMMAQTIGVWCGWHASKSNNAPRLGLLLGTRAFKTDISAFPVDSQLIIRIGLLLRNEKLGNFDCSVSLNGQTAVKARLTVYEPDEIEIAKLIQQGRQS